MHSTLKLFLDKKPLYYDEIDYTRMPRIYKRIKKYLPKPKVIHIIGTNGKGTTGRFLATALHNIGFSVGHYTSPHILTFNERIWIDKKNVTDKELGIAHQKLQKILNQDESNSLSYFEYTTFLSMLLFEKCHYVVMEAGLGGEHDATAVFDKILTLVTTIDIDHEAFLGNSIEDIATTKLNAMQKNIILGKQKFKQVQDIATKVADQKGTKLFIYKELLNQNDILKIKEISKKLLLAEYLVENLKLAISALKFLKLTYKVKDFQDSKLFGRLSQISKNILIDVGHNPLAASSITKALLGKKYILVYNTYKDKDYQTILKILKPIISYVEIIDINEERIETPEQLKTILNTLKIEYSTFIKTDKNLDYLVFGSFSVVERFLRVHNG